MTPKYFTSFANSHIVPLMKMSDKPHCLLTEDLKNMQTDFLTLNVRSCSWQYSVQIFNNDCSPDEDKEIKTIGLILMLYLFMIFTSQDGIKCKLYERRLSMCVVELFTS